MADLAHGTMIAVRDGAGASPGATVATSTSLCVAFLCNCQSGPCRDRRVRQALNYGVDVDEIVATLLDGAGTSLSGPLTPLHLGYDADLAPYAYDPDRARALLNDAGYAGGLELTVDIPTSHPDEAPELTRVIAEQLSRIGVTLVIRAHQDRQAYAEMVRAKQIGDACCFDSSPQSTFRVLREKLDGRSKGPWWQGYTSPEVTALIDVAARTPDTNQRRQVYQQAVRVIHEDAPWLFLYSPDVRFVRGTRLGGWRPGPNGLIQFS